MDDKPPKSLWGPWSPYLNDPIERVAQLRCIRTLVRMLAIKATCGDTAKQLERYLMEAEMGNRKWISDNTGKISPILFDEVALENARHLFDSLPALVQRQIIATFAQLTKPLTPQKEE
jgi:hypothetical protein